MKAALEKMGMDFIDNGNGSDVGNYRVRAEFTDRDGLTVIADFSGFNRWKVLGKTGCIVTHKNALHIDGTYRDEDGTGRDYAYRLRKNGFNFEKFSRGASSRPQGFPAQAGYFRKWRMKT